MSRVAGFVIHLTPGQQVSIDTRRAHVEHERIGGALPGAERPASLEGGHFRVGPGADLFALGSPDPDGWIMLEPSFVDRVPGQDTKLLQRVECCTRAIGQRTENESVDTILSETCKGAVTVIDADGFKA